jgi:glycosyltransferase involved in cell wall biosynthesis
MFMQRDDTCVIIPTYNNGATLADVIRSVAAYTPHILVVNDGSTDQTNAILDSFPSLEYVTYGKNMGKGWALRKGFDRARELGYRYAIAMDSDGQHFASDLPAFMDQVAAVPDALVVGARNMDQASVPGKSSFGHAFSNFWFTLETGIRCPDTQSGFRLYPIVLYKNTRFLTRKYEFEIEVLVRSAWKGIPIVWIPVKVYYPPKAERVSHFRPFRDFTRISLLNSVLVILTAVRYFGRRGVRKKAIFAPKTRKD